MKPLRSIVKLLIPARARHFLKAVHHNIIFWRAMKRFLVLCSQSLFRFRDLGNDGVG